MMETTQGNIIKQSLRLSKYSNSTYLLADLNIKEVYDNISCHCLSLRHRIFKVKSSVHRLCSHLYTTFLQTGHMISGTLISKIYDTGHSIVDCAISRKHHIPKQMVNNGISDSLQMVLSSENFRKPFSEDHILAVLLTKLF